jgi:hypothetical protein
MSAMVRRTKQQHDVLQVVTTDERPHQQWVPRRPGAVDGGGDAGQHPTQDHRESLLLLLWRRQQPVGKILRRRARAATQ